MLDPQAMLGGERDVLIHVALRVGHRGGRRGLVSDEVGGVGKTRKIKLFEDHRRTSLLGRIQTRGAQDCARLQ
jgi:hypothetical protein